MNEHQREYIKLLTSSMYDVQKVRLAIEGRIRAFSQTGGVSYLNMAEELKAELAELATEFEKGVERRIKEALKSAEIMKWLDKVSGIGPRYAGTLVGMIGAPPDTVSRLWSPGRTRRALLASICRIAIFSVLIGFGTWATPWRE